MKHRTWYKIISVLLSIVLLIGAVPTSVIALDEETAGIPPTVDAAEPNATAGSGSFDAIGSLDNIPLQAGEKSLAELQTMTVDLASIPEVIDVAHAQAKGHVNRLYAQENSLSTVIYQNRDGTKSTYFFSRPVKYVTADGTVRDRSSAVSPILNTTYSYAMLDNSTKVYFGKTADYGTLLQFGSYAINMTPKSEAASTAVQNEDGSILYGDVFGARTAVLYKAELNGLKEDIILFSNVGKSSFEFVLYAQNATPVQNGGVWQFENAAGDVVAQLDRIWVKDSAGHTTEGTLTLTPTDLTGFYDVTVSVAESFLNDDSTVYPVYIDPTTYIWEDDTYIVPDNYDMSYDSILDTGLYETADARDSAIQNMEMSIEMGDPLIHPVGGDGKLVYKFPSFYETYLWEGETYYCSSVYNLNASQIGRATLYFEELNGDSITLNVSAMTDTWDDTADDSIAVYEDGLWDAYSTQLQTLQTLTQNADGYYAADVTAIFKEWARYNEFERTNASTANNPFIDPANGLVLSNDAAYLCEILATATYGNATVYVEMDTSYFGGIFTVNNSGGSGAGLFLKNDVVTMDDTTTHVPTVATFAAGEDPLTPNYLWRFEYVGDNQYYIYTCVDNDYMLYAVGAIPYVQEMSPDLESRYRWTISVASNGARIIKSWNNRVLRCRNGYLVLTGELSSTDTNYAQTTWIIGAASGYVNMWEFEIAPPDILGVGETLSVNAVIENIEPAGASFVDASFFEYSSNNLAIAIINDNGKVEGVAPGTARITLTHKVTGATKWFDICVRDVLEDGIYCLEKVQPATNPYYLAPESTPSNMGTEWKYCVEQQTFSPQTQQWRITYLGKGYYSIQSVYTGGYLSVYNASANSGAPICLEPTFSKDSCSWEIYNVSDNYYQLLSKCGAETNQRVAIPHGSPAGTNCQQLGNETILFNNDKWYLHKIKYQATVNSYYDQGYLVRHDLESTDAAENIKVYLYYVAEKYVSEFGLLLTITTPQYYFSQLDQCKGEVVFGNLDALCSCALEHSSHIKRDFENDHIGNDVTTNIYWTGHKIVSIHEDGSTSVDRSFSSINHTVYMCGSWKHSEIQILSTLMHELAHQYEAPDHYHEIRNEEDGCIHEVYCDHSDCQGEGDRDSNCLMDEGTVTNSFGVFCTDCHADIETHLQSHHVIANS